MAVFRKDIDRKDIDKDVILNPIKTLTHRLIMFRWTFYTTSVWFLISKDHALLGVGVGVRAIQRTNFATFSHLSHF